VTFPEGYKESFTKYHTISFPATRQVRYYYATRRGGAAKGQALPTARCCSRSACAKLGADGKPATGADATS